jgi:hypothetical protein
MATNNNNYTGKYVFVTGFAGGREVFLGRAIDEPFNGEVTLEGKPIGFTQQGFMVVRPFKTTMNFPIADPSFQIQFVTHQAAIDEINNIWKSSISQLSRSGFPLTYRWIEAAIRRDGFTTANANGFLGNFFNRNSWFFSGTGNGFSNPFNSFYTGFTSSAEQFRRALFTSPQVNSTKEMDKITELEGDLTIDIGKITNEIAVKFNQMINRENELGGYFESIQGFNVPTSGTTQIGGWFYLINRLQIAKNWARRSGKTPFVREVNTLMKDGINRLNETILEHCGAHDTLITETCTQYGIQLEAFGEMSPFTSYPPPFGGGYDTSVDPPPSMPPVGIGG